jgi:hypothetical protein
MAAKKLSCVLAVGALCGTGACDPGIDNYGRGGGSPPIEAQTDGAAALPPGAGTRGDEDEDGSTGADGDADAATGDGGSTGMGEDDATGGDASPGFALDVWPLFSSRCGCHVGFPSGGLAMEQGSAHHALVGVRSSDTELALVEPGDPKRSYLWRKLMGDHQEVGGFGVPMPMSGTPLTDQELALVEAWIIEGALE